MHYNAFKKRHNCTALQCNVVNWWGVGAEVVYGDCHTLHKTIKKSGWAIQVWPQRSSKVFFIKWHETGKIPLLGKPTNIKTMECRHIICMCALTKYWVTRLVKVTSTGGTISFWDLIDLDLLPNFRQSNTIWHLLVFGRILWWFLVSPSKQLPNSWI